MSERYPGGFITKTPPTITGPTGGEGGSASGMWNLADVLENEKAGTWPKKILEKSLFVTGQTSSGELGLGDRVGRSSPVQLGSTSDAYAKSFVSNSTGYFIRQDGTLWASGGNGDGQLGINDNVNRSSPVQVGSLTNWSEVGGLQSTCVAVKTDGTLWTWGRNNSGSWGSNVSTTSFRSSPVQVGSDTDWAKPSGVECAGCFKTDGSLYLWGTNIYGRCGQNTAQATVSAYSSPVQVAGTWKAAELNTVGEKFNLCIKSDGTLWSWGEDNNGNLGLSDRNIDRSSPTQVGALTNWNQVASDPAQNASLVMATRTNNTAWYWGWDRYASGTAGVNSSGVLNSSPVQVGSDTNWEFVLNRIYNCFWKKTDGTFWGTGGGLEIAGTPYPYGQLGLDDGVFYSSPVQLGWIGTRTNLEIGDFGNQSNKVTVVFKD